MGQFNFQYYQSEASRSRMSEIQASRSFADLAEVRLEISAISKPIQMLLKRETIK